MQAQKFRTAPPTEGTAQWNDDDTGPNGTHRRSNLLTRIPDRSKRLGLIYLVLSLVWIIASDSILEYVFFSSGTSTITHWQIAKGIFFITATALVLFLVARRLVAAGEKVRTVFKTVFDSAAIGILVISKEGRVLEVNPSATRVSGYSPSEVIGESIEAHCYGEDVPGLRAALYAVSKGPCKYSDLTIRYICKRGELLWLHVTLARVRDSQMPLVVATVEDRTRERDAEEALRRSELRLHQFFDSDLLGIIFCNRDGTINEANDAYLKMVGYTREHLASGQMCDASVIPFTDGLTEQDGSPRFTPFETHLMRSDGEPIPVLIGGTFIDNASGDAVAYILDTTSLEEARREAKFLEEELRQAQKLQALGRLAGAISHDMNNLLSVVMGHAALIEAAVATEDPVRIRTQQILRSTEKGAALVRQLLAFSRQQMPKTEILDVNRRIEANVSMLRPLMSESIHVTFVAGHDIPAIEADLSQFDQVLLNLVLNARDAMPNGGEIKIETTVLSDEVSAKTDASQPTQVCMSVKDTGKGMSDSVREHLFEPFFTTKEPGKGTGLGLATVYGIVSKAGGRIKVESEVEKGSSFSIYLPGLANGVEERTDTLNKVIPDGMTGNVILAEDRPELRILLKELLQSFGFRVLDCIDGQDAIEKAADFGDHIDLVVTDVGMPRIGGVEAAERIRQTAPDAKVLYITGYIDETVPSAIDGAEIPVLLKPFTAEELASKIREILAGPQRIATKKPAARADNKTGHTSDDFRAA